VVAQFPDAGVRGDDRLAGRLHDVPKRLFADVRDVHNHAEIVHLAHNFLAEVGEPAVRELCIGISLV
jgi:hypothetical protein